MSIFVDTSAWYAVADRSDSCHRKAKDFYLATAGKDDLVTSDLVVAESWTLIAAHLGRSAALRFWEGLRDTGLPILTIEPPDLEAAWRIVQSYADQDLSLTDATSFALMERRGIDRVFTFDAHFLVYRYGTGRRRAFHRHPP